jgi:hypothetical protein
MQYTRDTFVEGRRMMLSLNSIAACLNANQSGPMVVDKWMEHSNGIASTSTASNKGICLLIFVNNIKEFELLASKFLIYR